MNSKNLRQIVVIDMESDAVKLIYGDVIKDEIIIKKVATSKLPEHIYQDGKIFNQEVLESFLKNMLKENKVKATFCFCCFESSQMITREVVIPNSSSANFQELVRYEMAQFLPIELNNYIVQAKIMRTMDIDGKPFMEALATAIPKSMVDQFHQMISNIGLKPYILDIHSNALSKLVEIVGQINKQDILNRTIGCVEFGYENIYISIFQNGKHKLSRLIPRGSKELDQNIAKFIEISVDDAAKRKMLVNNLMVANQQEMTEDASINEEVRIANVVKSTLESWFDEISKTFRYHATRNKEAENIQNVFVYGPMCQIKDLPDFFQSYFNIPTEKIINIAKIDWSKAENEEITNYLYALGTLYRR